MKKKKSTLSVPIILKAINGDIDAINAVLKSYEGYIAYLSTRRVYDDHGNVYTAVDEETRRRLETKLITKILQFKADY